MLTSLILWFGESLHVENFYDRPDMIFATLILSASAWRDLSAPDVAISDWLLQACVVGAALITIVSAAVFGFQAYTLSVGDPSSVSLERVFNFSGVLALVTLIGASILQLLIARGEATHDS
jgi:hypothetical protein